MKDINFSDVVKVSRQVSHLLRRLKFSRKDKVRGVPVPQRRSMSNMKSTLDSLAESIESLENVPTYEEVRIIGTIQRGMRKLGHYLEIVVDGEFYDVIVSSDNNDDEIDSVEELINHAAIDNIRIVFESYNRVLVEYSVQLVPIAITNTQEEFESLKKIIRGYSDKLETLSSHNESSGSELEAIKQHIEKLSEDQKNQTKFISSENAALTEKINSVELNNLELIHDESFELKKQLEEIHLASSKDAHSLLTASIAEFEKSSNTKVKEFQEKIKAITHIWEKTSEDAQKDAQTSIDKKIQELLSKIDELDKVLQKEIRKEVAVFANQKDKLTAILGSLSEFRRSKSDIDQAERERKTANLFRWIGLGLMFLPMISFIAFFVGLDVEKTGIDSLVFTFPDDPSGYFLRFLTIILFSTPSVYLLKESAYHRKQERHYRERGLQLASIGPFLDDYTPEQRVEAKNKLIDSFYCKNDGKADVSNIPDLINQIKGIAAVSKSISKIVPQSPPPNKLQDSQIRVETDKSIVNGSEVHPDQDKTEESKVNGVSSRV